MVNLQPFSASARKPLPVRNSGTGENQSHFLSVLWVDNCVIRLPLGTGDESSYDDGHSAKHRAGICSLRNSSLKPSGEGCGTTAASKPVAVARSGLCGADQPVRNG